MSGSANDVQSKYLRSISAPLESLDNVIRDKFFAQVLHVALGRAARDGFSFNAAQVVALPNVRAHEDDFAIVIVFQPRPDTVCPVPPSMREEPACFCFAMNLLVQTYDLKLHHPPHLNPAPFQSISNDCLLLTVG